MGIRIMDDGHSTRAVLYCSTTDRAIGYVADECEGCGMDAVQVLEEFLVFAGDREVADLRKVQPREYEELWREYWAWHLAVKDELADDDQDVRIQG